MPEAAFIKAVEDTLTRPYRQNSRYYEDFIQIIDQKLKQLHHAETKAKLEELTRRLVAQRDAEMAPTIGGSKTSID